MIKRILSLLYISLISITFSSAANAELFYIGLASGSAQASDNSIFDANQQTGHYLHFGLLSHHGLGIEIGYFQMLEQADASANPAIVKTSVSGYTSSLVGVIPTGNLLLFASAGAYNWSIKVEDVEQYSGSSPTFSLGADWLFSNNWSLRLEYARYLDVGPAESDISHGRMGISYNFY